MPSWCASFPTVRAECVRENRQNASRQREMFESMKEKSCVTVEQVAALRKLSSQIIDLGLVLSKANASTFIATLTQRSKKSRGSFRNELKKVAKYRGQ